MKHTRLKQYIYTYIYTVNTYIHKYIHAYTHTYTHTFVQTHTHYTQHIHTYSTYTYTYILLTHRGFCLLVGMHGLQSGGRCDVPSAQEQGEFAHPETEPPELLVNGRRFDGRIVRAAGFRGRAGTMSAAEKFL